MLVLSVGAAVNEQHRRILSARLPLRRFDDESLHAVSAGAPEPEVLDRIDSQSRYEGVVLVRHLVRVGLPVRRHRGRVDFRRLVGRVPDPCQRPPVGGQRERRVVVVAHDNRRSARLDEARAGRALLEREAIQLLAARIGRVHVERAHVRREEIRVRVPVPRGQQLARRLRDALVEHESPAVGLEPRASLRRIGDEPPVRRVHRILIRAEVRGGDHRGRAAAHWDHVEIDVRGPRIGASCILRRVRHLLTVRRKRVALTAAKWARRYIVPNARCQVAHAAAVGRDDKQMRSRAVVPRVPMPEHQLVRDVRLHRICRRCAVPRRAARVRRAVRIDARRERDQ